MGASSVPPGDQMFEVVIKSIFQTKVDADTIGVTNP